MRAVDAGRPKAGSAVASSRRPSVREAATCPNAELFCCVQMGSTLMGPLQK